MKKGDKVMIKYSGKIGIIVEKFRFRRGADRLIYFIETPKRECIGAIWKDLRKLTNEEYVTEAL